MSLLYLAALLISGGCMLLVDFRYRIFVFRAPLRALAVVAAGTLFFLLWDVVAIQLGIFLHGATGAEESQWMTGIMLGPELPLEEVVFLMFLCHVTMVLVLGAQRLLDRRKASL